MISSRATAAVERLFEKSLRENGGSVAEGGVIMNLVPEPVLPPGKVRSHLIALGISSYLFRIVTLFDFAADKATAAHLTKTAPGTAEVGEGKALQDAYAEFVNMICGTVNRGLQTIFPHTGMSTPFPLESGCASYLDTLKPTHCRSFEAVINDALRFRLTLCICVASDAPLDFHIDVQEEDGASAGELELF